jgi:hypothetical protein
MPDPMVTALQFLKSDIRPALRVMPRKFQGPHAECMLAAIPAQETNYASVYQLDEHGQPIENLARGLYQFELGGVQATLVHESNFWLRPFLMRRGFISPTPEAIHYALPASSSLAVWIARSNLWWYHKPLVDPIADAQHEEESWQYYLFCWRPGKPHRELWHDAWYNAVAAVNSIRRIY